MKNKILLLCLLLAATHLQAQTWQWARQNTGGSAYYYLLPSEAWGATAVTTDATGNVYMVGSYDGYIAFGSITLGMGVRAEGFVVKYDASGNVKWAKSINGANQEALRSVKVDANGNVYVSGYSESPLIYFDTITLDNSSGASIFLAKYDSSGNIIWVRKSIGNNYESYAKLAIDNFGNVLMYVNYRGYSITLGGYTLINTSSSTALVDIALVKYDPLGNVLWAKNGGGVNDDYMASIDVDQDGSAYIVGFTQSPTMNFSGTVLNIVGSTGFEHAFMVKFDSAGSLAWAKSYGGDSGNSISSINVSNSGSIYTSGDFVSTNLLLDTITLHGTNGYLAKYNQDGNIYWARPTNYAGDTKIDSNGFIYLPVYYDSIFKYDSMGILVWKGSTSVQFSDFAVEQNNIYTIGNFQSPTIHFGSIVLLDSTSCCVDVYIAKCSPPPVFTPNSIKNDMDAAIYPNPNNGNFAIKLPEIQSCCNVIIYDLLGRVVATQKSCLNNKQIQLQLPNGTYILELSTEDKVNKLKLVIIK